MATPEELEKLGQELEQSKRKLCQVLADSMAKHESLNLFKRIHALCGFENCSAGKPNEDKRSVYLEFGDKILWVMAEFAQPAGEHKVPYRISVFWRHLSDEHFGDDDSNCLYRNRIHKDCEGGREDVQIFRPAKWVDVVISAADAEIERQQQFQLEEELEKLKDEKDRLSKEIQQWATPPGWES